MRNKVLAGLCAVILLAGVIGSLLLVKAPHGTLVQIVQDGRTIQTLDLSSTENRTFDVEYEGRKNTVEIRNGKIHILDADCPDKTCVHMGWLESSALPIVCLPNHLSISFSEPSEEIDAILN